jgi:hypothetical protein
MFHRHHHHRLVDSPRHRLYRHVAWGGALIAVGVAALLRGQDLFNARDLWLLAPALLAWTGIVRIVVERTPWSVAHGAMRLAIAAYLYIVIEHVGGLTFSATWPVLLIAAGTLNVAHAVFGRRVVRCEEPNW